MRRILFKLNREPRMVGKVLKGESMLSIDSNQEQKVITVIGLLGKSLRWRLCAGSLLSSALRIHACHGEGAFVLVPQN